jgi:protein O-mannosyl-transferase
VNQRRSDPHPNPLPEYRERGQKTKRWLIPAGIAVAIFVTYANALHGPFIFDDLQAITNNSAIRSLSTAMSAPPQSAIDGRPLVCLSLALNYAIGGYDPVGYHLFNLATHIACALLLYGLIRRTVPNSLWFAAAVALVWGVHPINTEAVNYVTQRTETMESMFLLLMLYSMSYGSTAWNVVAVCACAAGMACKEQMVVAPLLAVVYDWVFGRHRRGRWVYAALFACWLILPLELQGIDFDSRSGYGLKYLTPFDYLKTQALVILHYIRLCFWPRGLVIDYTDWPIEHGIRRAIVPGLEILTLLVVSIILAVKRSWVGFVGVWFFLVLAPTSSVLPNFTEIAAERRMYLASISIVILTLAVLPRKAVLIPILAIAFAVASFERNIDYRSSIGIWSDAVEKRPGNWHAHYFLARSYAELSEWGAADSENEIAMKLEPRATAPKTLQEYIRQHSGE